jgi:uncharacterized membrane protein
LVPLICTVLAIGLGLGSIALDQLIRGSIQFPFLISSGVDGARALLSAIASSMITFTGLVFSITIVTLQLTSSQFSPRVLRTFLRDRFNQLTLGIFIATFVYAMVVLRSARGTDDQLDAFVPQLGVNVAFLLVLASVVVFLIYIHHITQSIRAANIIARSARRPGLSSSDAIPSNSTNGTPPSTSPVMARAGRPASSRPHGRASSWPSTMSCWPGWPRTAPAWCCYCVRSESSCQRVPPCSGLRSAHSLGRAAARGNRLAG